MPFVPRGFYAVPDPHEPARMTIWSSTGTELKDHPAGVRHRPLPPKSPGSNRDEREAELKAWYRDVYWPWRRKVAESILADLEGAESAYRAYTEFWRDDVVDLTSVTTPPDTSTSP